MPVAPDLPRWDVVGVGANCVDYVYRLPGVPQSHGPASKMPISDHYVSCGGQAATALCTCARLGLRTKYVGAIGDDDNGRRVRDEMTRRGIDLSAAIGREAPNAFALILVDARTGERIVLWRRDERLRLEAGDLSPETFAGVRLVHVDDVDETASLEAARFARRAGLPVTSDIDRIGERTDELVASVTVPILAEHVPKALTGEEDFERALRKLRGRHPGLLCVTLGDRGAMLLDGDRLHHAPAFAVRVVDTTGAGDVFRGAFIHAYLRGEPPAEILRFANAAAAVSCTTPGAINGVPSLADTNQLLQGSVPRR